MEAWKRHLMIQVRTSAPAVIALGQRISEVGETPDREAFQGQEFRKDVNHYNLGVRNMQQDSGHWLQPEPMVILGLDANRVGDPLQFNPYRYTHNNPVNLIDPTGFWTVPIVYGPVPSDAIRNTVADGLDWAAEQVESVERAHDIWLVSDNALRYMSGVVRPEEMRYAIRQPNPAQAAMGLSGAIGLPIGMAIGNPNSFMRYLVTPGNPQIFAKGSQELEASWFSFLGENFSSTGLDNSMSWARSIPLYEILEGGTIVSKAGDKAIISVSIPAIGGGADLLGAIEISRELANAYKTAYPSVNQVSVSVELMENQVYTQAFLFEQLGAKTVSE